MELIYINLMPYEFNTTSERSEIMRRIKSKDTAPEIALRKALWNEGFRYRKNYSKLPGKPDIVYIKQKLAIFIDGGFWHGYNWEKKKAQIKSNRSYWIKKIERNIERDKEVNNQLNSQGWKVIRFWDFDIKKNIDNCIENIINYLDNK